MRKRDSDLARRNQFAPPPIGPEPTWIEGRFRDDIWGARASGDGVKRVCNFVQIPPEFRYTAKCFLWTLEYVSDHQIIRRTIRVSSVYVGYYYELRTFIFFIANVNGHKTLQEVSRDDIVFYITKRIGDAKAAGYAITQSYTTRISSLLERLYALGPAGSGDIPDGLLVNFDQAAVKRVIRSAAETLSQSEQTPIVPETVMRKTFNAAYEFLDYADPLMKLLAAQTDYDRSCVDLSARRFSGHLQRAKERFLREHRLLDEVNASIQKLHPISHLAPADQIASDFRGTELGQQLSLMMRVRLNVLLAHLTTACFIVIATLTGFRSGEILSIKRGAMRRSGGDLMIITAVSKSIPREEGREVGRPGPIVLERVGSILERLSALYERDQSRLWQTPVSGYLDNLKLSKMLNTFLGDVAGEHEWHMTSRQFRRYFAIFFIRRFEGPEDAVRLMFLHVSAATSASYTRDRETARYLLEAKYDKAVEINRSLAARDHKYISRSTATPLEYAAQNMNIERISKVIEAAPRDLEAWPTAWGICMVRKGDASGAVCGGTQGVPDVVEMHPGNCGICRHLAVGPEHRPFWQHFKETFIEVRDNRYSAERLKRAAELAITTADNFLGGPSGAAT